MHNVQYQREKNLFKNTIILSLGSFVPKLFSFIVTPLLTGNLTKADYGEFDLITTLVSLMLPAVTLQISSAAFRFLIDTKNDKEESSKIITGIYCFVTIMALLTSTVFYVVYGYRDGAQNGILICFYFIADILLQSSQQVMRGLGKNIIYSASTIISSGVNMLLIVLLIGGYVLQNQGLRGVLISLVVAQIVANAFIIWKGKIFSYVKIRNYSFSTIKKMLQYSWPMVPNNLSGWVLRLSDRLVITAALGIEANAIYAVANKLPTLISALQSTFIFAWQENASIAAKDSDRSAYYSKMCDFVYRLLIGFTAILIAMTPIIWRILIRGDYDEAYYQLPVLYLGMVFSSMASVVGGIYIAFKKTVNVGITTMIAAAINLTIDLVFVRFIGIWAGSISTMVSYLALFIYRMYDVQKFQKVKFDVKLMILGIIPIILMMTLNARKIFWLDILNCAICIFVIILFDRNVIWGVFTVVKNKIRHSK